MLDLGLFVSASVLPEDHPLFYALLSFVVHTLYKFPKILMKFFIFVTKKPRKAGTLLPYSIMNEGGV